MGKLIDDALLKEVKNFIDQTWDDDAGDEKLSGIIFRGMNRINKLCGKEFDYSTASKDSEAKDLLLNYVMYARADALDDWEKNYAANFNMLQLIQEVNNYVESTQAEQGIV